MKRKQNIRWNTMKILVIGFLSVIDSGSGTFMASDIE